MEDKEPGVWVYQVDRDNGNRLSWGIVTDQRYTPQEMAFRLAQQCRAEHSYYTGVLKVWVWPERDGEHYRRDVPDNASLCVFGEGDPEVETIG